MTAAELVRAIRKRATPSEWHVVEGILLAIGELWRCPGRHCGAVNAEPDLWCSGCSAARPRRP